MHVDWCGASERSGKIIQRENDRVQVVGNERDSGEPFDVSSPFVILGEGEAAAWSWFPLWKGTSYLRRWYVSTSLPRGNKVDGLPRASKCL